MNTPERLPLEPATPPQAASAWRRLSRFAVLPVAVACFGLGGCASFWDDVTSRDFEFRSLWVKPDPLVVLKESTDNDKKAKAYRALHEPAQYGGSQEEQNEIVDLLCKKGLTERTALCRQAAIASLRTFKDPRVWPALQSAYYGASSFPPDTATILRCQVLEAVGQVGNPDAVAWLVTIVKQPPAADKETERGQNLLLQERIAAARALGHYKNYQGAETLLTVLKTEKDPGLRDGAAESLQMATGKRYPADAQAWDQYLHGKQDKDAIFGEPSISDRVMDIVNVSWWWK